MTHREKRPVWLLITHGIECKGSEADALRKQDRALSIARLRDAVLHVEKGPIRNQVPGGSVKRMLKLIALILMVWAGSSGLTGCAMTSTKPSDDAATVRSAIEKANQAFVEASMRADPQGMAGAAAEEFVEMSVDGGPDQVGRSAYLAELNRRVPARPFTLVERKAFTDTVEVFGDFAYEIGRNFAVRKSKTNSKGKLDTAQSRYITFWKKQADGTWKTVRDMTVPVPPAKP